MKRDDTRVFFHAMGALALLGALIVCQFMSMREVILRNRGVDALRVWPVALWLFVSGIGMLRCTRWGAALMSIGVTGGVAVSVFGAVSGGAYAAAIIPLLLLTPVVVTILRWRLLRPWW